MIKIFKHILIGLLAVVIAINAIAYILLSIPAVQRNITHFATKELSERLHTQVNIHEVDFEFLNKLVLKDVYLEDQKGNEMLKAKKMSVGIDLIELFRNKLIINTVQLYSFQLRLSKETPKSKPNYQFVLDALKSNNKQQKGLTEIQIKSIIIRRGNVNYDVWSVPYKFGQFNASHMRIKNLLASVSLHTFSKDSVNADVRKLSFEENSGLKLRKLSMQFTANRKQAVLTDFVMNLPSSVISLKNIYLDYSKVDSTHRFRDFAKFNIELPNAKICLQDISPFVPIFRYYTDVLTVDAKLGGTVNSLDLKNLKITSGDRIKAVAQVHVEEITDLKNAYVFGKIADMRIVPEGFAEILRNLSIQSENLDNMALRAGNVEFKGEVSGYFSDLVAFGTLKTGLGTVRTDIKIGKDTTMNRAKFRGKLRTDDFDLGKLLDNSHLGIISFNLLLDGYQNENSLPQGKVDGEIAKMDYNSYRYNNIQLNGLFEGTRYEGEVEIDDPNGYFYLNGKIDKSPKRGVLQIETRMRDVNLSALNLSDKYPNSKLSFVLKSDLSGSLPDAAVGVLSVDSLSFKQNNDEFVINKIRLTSSNQGGQQSLRIASPFVNGELKGIYAISTLQNSALTMLARYLPSITHKVNLTNSKNNFDFSFRISNSEKLSEILGLPFTFYKESVVKGAYNDFNNHFYVESNIPAVRWGKSLYESISIVSNNDDDKANLLAKVMNTNKKNDHFKYVLDLSAHHDLVNCKVNWSNSGLQTYSGTLDLKSKLSERNIGLPKMDISVLPSSIIMNDTTWNVSQSKIVLDSSRVAVHDFEVSKSGQYLRLDGSVSKSTRDTLFLSLRKINLDYIFNILNIKHVQFGGNATGDFVLTNLLKTPILLTNNLNVKDFAYNKTRFGDFQLFSEWDAEKKGILIKGVVDGYLKNKTFIHCYIFPTKDSIALNINANRLNLEFLRAYLGGFMKDITGLASGNIKLGGKFSALNLSGDAKMEQFRFGVDYLNTYYTVSDSVHFRPNLIYFNNINMLDKDKNVAIGSGKIRHTNLSNWRYDVQINTRNFLSYNATSLRNPIFYGPVYGAGSVSITGNEAKTNIDVNMQATSGSKFVVSLNNQMTAADYGFITFRDRQQELLELQKADEEEFRKKLAILSDKPSSSSNELNINLLVDITPTANLNLVMDPTTGDVIETNGNGNLRVSYNNKKDAQIYGTYTIERGVYNFSLQNFIKKRFAIKEGSTVTFRGDPYTAELGLKAIYTTTADLTDLDESFSTDQNLSRTNTQVQCLLDITGDMKKPDLKFDLNFPNNNEEVNRRVRSIVNTDDMMARQVVYLMTINRFYTPDYLNNGLQRANQLSSLASATLSSQFNNLVSQLTDKVNIGTNVKLDNTAYTNMEVEVALSSQLLNNRLLVNGNFGYRDNVSNKATFIGDFDFEWKLTKSGDYRLKGFNRTNDRFYYIKSSLTTQGLGFMYKKDFNNLLDLFKKRINETPAKKE
ncbi:MAG: translocation/assembly module TamB domain-containing protein [Bacteroidales bacterium]